MNKLSSQYIADILNDQMSLASTSSGAALLRDQNFKIPTTPDLFVVVGIVKSVPMAAQSYMETASPKEWDEAGAKWDQVGQVWDQTNPGQVQIQRVQMQDWVQIDVCSRDNSAIMRNWEVIAAMNSFQAKQIMEQNSFKIFRLSQNMLNTSGAEGGSQLNRYTITFPAFVWYIKRTVMPTYDYYDDFTTREDNEKSIGTDKPAIHFEINQEGIEP